LAFTLATVGAVSVGTASAAPYCGITWGSLAKAGGQPASQQALDFVRTGQHDCYDRVVYEFSGPVDGYRVEYVPEVRTDGAGQVLAVAGGAVLRVRLEANVFDQLGHLHYPARVGDHVANVNGYRTLRDVVYGGCFEGATTFGVGVRARLPFRVFTLAGPGTHSRIVVDFAHQW
ncbi:MAG: hypothetical protein ABR540_22035, partial [Acidimicrobiales bacterium]